MSLFCCVLLSKDSTAIASPKSPKSLRVGNSREMTCLGVLLRNVAGKEKRVPEEVTRGDH